MAIITIVVVFALMYVSYESISKPYQEQKTYEYALTTLCMN